MSDLNHQPNNIAKPVTLAEGVRYYPEALKNTTQQTLLGKIREILTASPLYQPTMPRSGKPLSVQMSNCGELGWVSDRDQGYRYQAHHPVTGENWPAMPSILPRLWRDLTRYPAAPEACLINYYTGTAKMGLHRDDDEDDKQAPIMSISLGDNAWFRYGGVTRSAPTSRIMLRSGDIICMSGPARLIYHGIDRILPGSSTLLEEGGRFNLTLRRVTIPGDKTPPDDRNSP